MLFPTTLLFCIALIFNLNVTTGPLLGYILFCQAHVVTAADENYLIRSLASFLPSQRLYIIFRSSLFLSSLWTLKFFQGNFPPFCISGKMTGIHVHMLSLIPTLYLLFLFAITYLIIDCNVQYTSHLSRPGKVVVTYFTKLKQKLVARFCNLYFLINDRNYLRNIHSNYWQ